MNKMKLIWQKIDDLHIDILYYAFMISIILFFVFLPFSIKESLNFLIFGILCLFFHNILRNDNIETLDKNIF